MHIYVLRATYRWLQIQFGVHGNPGHFVLELVVEEREWEQGNVDLENPLIVMEKQLNMIIAMAGHAHPLQHQVNQDMNIYWICIEWNIIGLRDSDFEIAWGLRALFYQRTKSVWREAPMLSQICFFYLNTQNLLSVPWDDLGIHFYGYKKYVIGLLL